MSLVTNVIKMRSQPQATPRAIPLVLPLDDVERTREALLKLEVAAQLGQSVLDRSTEHGDDEALDGVRQVFSALSALLVPAIACIVTAVDLDGIYGLIV
jgi:hypothetical protein